MTGDGVRVSFMDVACADVLFWQKLPGTANQETDWSNSKVFIRLPRWNTGGGKSCCWAWRFPQQEICHNAKRFCRQLESPSEIQKTRRANAFQVRKKIFTLFISATFKQSAHPSFLRSTCLSKIFLHRRRSVLCPALKSSYGYIRSTAHENHILQGYFLYVR